MKVGGAQLHTISNQHTQSPGRRPSATSLKEKFRVCVVEKRETVGSREGDEQLKGRLTDHPEPLCVFFFCCCHQLDWKVVGERRQKGERGRWRLGTNLKARVLKFCCLPHYPCQLTHRTNLAFSVRSLNLFVCLLTECDCTLLSSFVRLPTPKAPENERISENGINLHKNEIHGMKTFY